ncbi:DUF3011 domain-containing protein [Dyella psychrodurans]|uniref:DUF3011 domain-containing protein n=1 Tax=Dyella psychrodurans TaxID=1927960 RepID=A0A370XCQ9_9GAMM|nr:DUF3011 domain-containing protein [Dyella psychrodurans]RDS86050.1 DUF3011 domain-containing protein [Dyella psychrodurans]
MSAVAKALLTAIAGFAVGALSAGVPPVHAQGARPTVYCASNDNRFARCQVPWRDAQLMQQMSQTRCVRDQTWGFDRGSIWVDRGCRGQFADARGGWGDHPRGPQVLRIRCESSGGNYRFCPVGLRRDDVVRIDRQLSSARCRQDDGWGWRPDGIWVNRGCRADFIVERRY